MFNSSIRSIAVTHFSIAVAGCSPLKFWKQSRILSFVSIRRRLGPDLLGILPMAGAGAGDCWKLVLKNHYLLEIFRMVNIKRASLIFLPPSQA